MIHFFLKLLSCPIAVLAGITAISIFSLIAALGSEVFLGLEPCILCIYQRFPYLAVMIFGIAGLALKNRPPLPRVMIGLSGLSILINCGIAFYHTGDEQKWWASSVEGCSVQSFGNEPQSILENILSAPTANCAEIPWQDPIIGLSMANYNVLLCFGLFVICAISFVRLGNTHKV